MAKVANTIAPTKQDGDRNHFFFELINSFTKLTTDVYFFNLQPEEYTRDEPNSVVVTRTIGGAFVDDFGVGVPRFSIRGHTGWGLYSDPRNGVTQDGFEFWLALEDIKRQATGNGLVNRFDTARVIRANTELRFIDPQNIEAWEVVVEKNTLRRSRTRPHLFQYDMSFIGIRLLGTPNIFDLGLGDDIGDALRNAASRTENAFRGLDRKIQEMKTFNPTINTAPVVYIDGILSRAGIPDFAITVFSSIERLRDRARSFINRETSFIDIPLTILDNTIDSIRNTIDDLENVISLDIEDVDLGVLRLFKGVFYDTIAFDRASFAGLVSTDSITGESTGAASFGKRSSLLKDSDNALIDISGNILEPIRNEFFKAKADPVNEVPEITVNDQISEVIGVFILDDPLEQVNLFESFSGNRVRLKSNPHVPYVVRYRRLSDKRDLRNKISALKRVPINDGDTIQEIALKFLGDARKWEQIASINGLEFPYIAPTDFETEFKATGEVTLTRETGFFATISIPQGTIVKVPQSDTYFRDILFVTTTAATLAAGNFNVTIPIECSEIGAIGNVNDNQIIALEVAITGIATVTNEEPTNGGRLIRVKRIGESMNVPSLDINAPVIVNAREDLLFGIDVKLELLGDLEGEFTASSGVDFSRIAGIENIKQALEIRFRTLRGELPFHSRYGTILPLLVGRASTDDLMLLAELEIKEVLLSEPRIEEIEKLTLTFDGDKYDIRANVRLIEGNQVVPLNLIARV